MILHDTSLRSRALNGLVDPYLPGNVQGSSIDLTLGSTIKVENMSSASGEKGRSGVTLTSSSPTTCIPTWRDIDITQPYNLHPGEFILAHTAETVAIPEDCCAMVLLRSSAARAGYEHSLAGWCDPSFTGQITLELRNNLCYHSLPVQAGMRLCQLVVHKLENVPEHLYAVRGNYQGQKGATASNANFSREAA